MSVNVKTHRDTLACRLSAKLYRGSVNSPVGTGQSTSSKGVLTLREEVARPNSVSADRTAHDPNIQGDLKSFVYVLNKNGKPLMPCKPAKAAKLLKAGKAKVRRRTLFTIQLLWNCEDNVQEVIAGMDTGSKKIGCAASGNGKVLYQSEIEMRQDVSKKMQQRKMYRRNRRSRKTRYRKCRFINRSSMRTSGRLAPSIRSKIDSHLREKLFVESILPISKWKVETTNFDIHKITNPEVSSTDYQEGSQKGFYNVKAYILHRDNYKCQSKQKVQHDKKLHVHHVIHRINGGTNYPENLIVLCKQCHEDLHKGKFEIKEKKNKTKHATEVNIVKSQLKKRWSFEETFGYETKFKRENILKLDKTHFNDAIAICYEEGENLDFNKNVFYKKHVSKGDYQQTKGKRSEKRIPTGKIFGFRKHDLIETSKGIGFVKGKRSSGFFAIEDFFGKILHSSVNVKKDAVRLSARKTTIGRVSQAAPWLKPGVSCDEK